MNACFWSFAPYRNPPLVFDKRSYALFIKCQILILLSCADRTGNPALEVHVRTISESPAVFIRIFAAKIKKKNSRAYFQGCL
jgi:hypothetical protein